MRDQSMAACEYRFWCSDGIRRYSSAWCARSLQRRNARYEYEYPKSEAQHHCLILVTSVVPGATNRQYETAEPVGS